MSVTVRLGSCSVALGAYKLLIIGAILLVGYLVVPWHPFHETTTQYLAETPETAQNYCPPGWAVSGSSTLDTTVYSCSVYHRGVLTTLVILDPMTMAFERGAVLVGDQVGEWITDASKVPGWLSE